MDIISSATRPLVPSNVQNDTAPTLFEVGDLAFDHANRVVKRNGLRIPLSGMRYTILYMLARHAHERVEHPLYRRVILHELYGHNWPSSNSFNVQMWKLRDDLNDAESVVSIRTFYGQGFKLVIRAYPAVPQ